MSVHRAPRHQHTVYVKASIEGVGLHSGRRVRLTLHPAPVDSGVVFVRTDLAHPVEIPARADYVTDTTLNTTLGRDGVGIGTVEHLLAALYGLGVDNVRVEVDGPELPVLDGSAAPFVALVDQAGVREQKAPRKVAVLRRALTVREGDKEVRVSPASALTVHCSIDFRHPLITDQKFGLEVTPKSFVRDIAPARTFGFLKDVDRMQTSGYARGGSLHNAIVVDDFHILNPEGLRFPDEFVRHKVLDALGDLSLLGLPLVAHLHAHKPGHKLNHRLVSRLLREPDALEIVTLGDAPAPRPEAEVELPLGGLEGIPA